MNIRRQNGNFQFEEGVFSKVAQGVIQIYHEVLQIKILQTKPQIRSMNINYYDLYYTILKNRGEKQTVIDEHGDNESDYFIYDNFITRNHYIGRKNDDVIIR